MPLPAARSVGHGPESNAVGIPKEFWVTDENGQKLQLLSRPLAPGLEGMTVFCWFPAEPFGYVGAEILFSGNVRP